WNFSIRSRTLSAPLSAGLELSPASSHVMLCGNPQMVDDTKEALKRRGLTMNRRGEGNIAVENYW
ncbi:ferredoxin--NADP(+) reductase, partial [Klebsiella pneumoniae]